MTVKDVLAIVESSKYDRFVFTTRPSDITDMDTDGDFSRAWRFSSTRDRYFGFPFGNSQVGYSVYLLGLPCVMTWEESLWQYCYTKEKKALAFARSLCGRI